MESLYQLMLKFLKNGGIKAQEGGDGRIIFSVNNLNFMFASKDSDAHFMRLSLPNISIQPVAIDDKINELNRNYKVAKIVCDSDGKLWILADAFVYNTEQVEPLFVRLIQALTDMYNDYRTKENNDNGTVQEK